MRPAHVEVLVAIAEAGSLVAAAEILRKTQPAVTKVLKVLEEELGAPLFTRAARGVRPTEIGQRVIAHARIIQAELQKLDEDVQQMSGTGGGSLHVTVSPLAAVRIVPGAIEQFRVAFPNVRVQIAGGHPPSTLATLRSGDTDIVIGPAPDADDRAGLDVHTLFASPLSVITGKGSRYTEARRLSDLTHGEWVMIGPRNRAFGIKGNFLALGLDPPVPSTSSDSISSLLAMIENSDRLCSFPALMLDEVEPRWNIVRLRLEDRLAPVEISLTMRADRHLTPAGRRFAEAVFAQAGVFERSLSDN